MPRIRLEYVVPLLYHKTATKIAFVNISIKAVVAVT
jgi:hypothetical protein